MFFHKPKLNVDFHDWLLLKYSLSVCFALYTHSQKGGVMSKVIFGLLIFIAIVLFFLLFWIVVLSAALLFFGRKSKKSDLLSTLPTGR
jgi:hypothetical protein